MCVCVRERESWLARTSQHQDSRASVNARLLDREGKGEAEVHGLLSIDGLWDLLLDLHSEQHIRNPKTLPVTLASGREAPSFCVMCNRATDRVVDGMSVVGGRSLPSEQ